MYWPYPAPGRAMTQHGHVEAPKLTGGLASNYILRYRWCLRDGRRPSLGLQGTHAEHHEVIPDISIVEQVYPQVLGVLHCCLVCTALMLSLARGPINILGSCKPLAHSNALKLIMTLLWSAPCIFP